MSQILTAFYSATGTTRSVAEILSGEAGSDLFEIRPAQPYTYADMNWSVQSSRSAAEHRDTLVLPQLADICTRSDSYQTILLGFPIWYGDTPAVIRSFLESHDLGAAEVILFATSSHSSLGTIPDRLQALYPHVRIRTGRVLSGPHVTAGYLRKWLRGQRII